jgi:hypothetical protein
MFHLSALLTLSTVFCLGPALIARRLTGGCAQAQREGETAGLGPDSPLGYSFGLAIKLQLSNPHFFNLMEGV